MLSNPQLHKLLILSQDFEEYNQLLSSRDLPGLTLVATDEPAKAIQLGVGCDLLFGEPSRVSQVLNNLPGIKWVQTTWAGIEPLLTTGMRRDYLLTNARDVYGSMMSEYVFAYLLMIERRILPRRQAQLSAKWDQTPNGSLKDKILGLLGVGTIGSYLAATARHFNMQVYGFTRQTESCVHVNRYFHHRSLLEFASNLDYLVCALPETPSTKCLVDRAFLTALPDKAWLVNIGRGSTIDEHALVETLNNGTLAGAILDVFTQEPLPLGHPLWSTPNTFITCHTAARNYLPDIVDLFVENYTRYVLDRPLIHLVDFEQGY